MTSKNKKPLIGWREWGMLEQLDVPLIKVKIDTGAKTSAIHAHDIKIVKSKGKEFAEFIVYPLQNNNVLTRKSRAEIVDLRNITSSNGHKQERIVIRTPIMIGGILWEIDLTLTNRDIMRHRMLLGRDAMKHFLVDPSKSYCQGIKSQDEVKVIYEDAIFV